MKRNYSIFLASSNELLHERKEFEIAIRRLMKHYEKNNVAINLKVWEDIDDAVNTTCKQEDYNEYLRKCQIFVMLFWTKVGKYTREEFDLAYQLFLKTGSPKMYLYEKTVAKDGIKDWEKQSKDNFIAFLKTEGKEQFQSTFEHPDTFIRKFEKNLEGLFHDLTNSLFTYGSIAKLISTNGAREPLGFLGRENELSIIREKLGESGKLMLINAEGGIGKTTLAAKYWHDNLYNYQYNAWLYCENGIIVAFKELAPKLGIDLANIDEAQQLKFLKEGLSKLHDDFLLVLDNANDAKEIKLFKQEFEGFHWHVLFTSRCANILHPSQELAIIHLPPKLAKELFIRHYQEKTDEFETLLDRVLIALNYHTLLIEIFAKNLKKASKNGLKLQAFLGKLANEGLFLGDDSFEIQTEYTGAIKNNAATTDEILEILYDFTKLSENERHTLVNIALLPAETYTDVFLRDLMADNNKLSSKNYLNTLESLFQKGWLSGTINENYRISPVIQELVLKKNHATLGMDAQKLLYKLNTILKTDAFNLINIELNDAIPYVKPIEHLSKCLIRHPSSHIANYNFFVGIYYENIGDLISAEKCYQNYHSIYQKFLETESENLEYKNGLAISYSKLGGIYEATGDWKNAQINFQQTNQLLQKIYESNPENLEYKNGLAISYSKLGDIYKGIGDWKNAQINFQQTIQLFQEISESNPQNLLYKNGLAISYEKLGEIYEAFGNWKNALFNFQQTILLFQEIYQSNPKNLEYKNGLAISYEKLGGVYQATGNWENAQINFQERYRISKEIHESSLENLEYKNGVAISYSNLGGVYQATGNWKNALFNFQEQNKFAKEIYESSPKNLSYKHGLAISYSNLGGVYQATGNWKNALFNFHKDFRLTKEIYESSPENLEYKNGLAISYEKLGLIYETNGDWKNALFNFQERNRITKEIYESSPQNLSYKNGLAISFIKLANVLESEERYKEVINTLMEAKKHFQEIYQVTQGNIILFTYNYAWVCWKISNIYQIMPNKEIFNELEIKQIQKEGYDALKPLADAGLLQENQKILLQLLNDGL